MGDAKFTKIASSLLIDVRDLVDWGIAGKHTTRDKLMLTVEARKEEAEKLVSSGVSQRKAAKLLGVDPRTIRRDLGQKAPRNGAKGPTDSARLKVKKLPPPYDPIDELTDIDPEETAEHMRSALVIYAGTAADLADKVERFADLHTISDEAKDMVHKAAAAWARLEAKIGG